MTTSLPPPPVVVQQFYDLEEILQIIASFCHVGELNRFAAVCRNFCIVAGRSYQERIQKWSRMNHAPTIDDKSLTSKEDKRREEEEDDGISPMLYDYNEAPVCYTHAWWKWFDNNTFDNKFVDNLKIPCKLDRYGESPHHWECETETHVVMMTTIDNKKKKEYDDDQPQQQPILKLVYNDDEFYQYKNEIFCEATQSFVSNKEERWYPIDFMIRLLQSQTFVLPAWSQQGLTHVRHASLMNHTLLLILCQKDRQTPYITDTESYQTLYAVIYTNVPCLGNNNKTKDGSVVVVHYPCLVSQLTALGPECCGVINRSKCFIGNTVRSANDRIAVITTIKNEECIEEQPRFGGRNNDNDDVTVTVYQMIIGTTKNKNNNKNQNKDNKQQVPDAAGGGGGGTSTASDVSLIREYSIPVDFANSVNVDYADIQLSLSPSGNILSIRNKISCYENGGWTIYDLSNNNNKHTIPMEVVIEEESNNVESQQQQEENNTPTPTIVFHIPVTSVWGPDNDAIQSISYTLDNELIVQWKNREDIERFLRLGNHPERNDSLWEESQQPRGRGRYHRIYQNQRKLKCNIQDLPIQKLPKVIAKRIIFIAGWHPWCLEM